MKTAACLLVAVLAACGNHRPPRQSGPEAAITISVEQQSAWVRNFNPLLPPGSSRWPTRQGVYEPLLIYNIFAPGGGAWTPWLAESYTWSADLLKLRFAIRPGVRWSDGQPFSSADVAYTFELMRRHPVLDLGHAWGYLNGVTAVDPLTVEFSFSVAFSPGLEDIAHQVIVPRHIWEKVPDPTTWANPNPVGTGPFTQVKVFRPQVYEVGRNPFYWQPGKPAVAALRFLAYPSNDQANQALAEGDVDWAGNFVPAVDRTFVARDRAHRTAWSPLVGNMVLLLTNNARPPFNDVRVRKALSMAIDRKRLVEVALYGMTRPADATGLHDGYPGWHDAAAGEAVWMHHDVAAAAKLLDEAGCPLGADGVRVCTGGHALDIDIEVVSGWSDWVRATQLIARDLEAVGVHAHLRTYDFGAWMSRLQQGEFSLSVAYSWDGPTPYRFYRFMMGSELVKPLGQQAAQNWHRFGGDAQADALLDAWERAGSFEEQRRIAVDLQHRFADAAPSIPLFANPMWGEFSTERFTGFPDAKRPFARLSPYAEPDTILVLTELKPRQN